MSFGTQIGLECNSCGAHITADPALRIGICPYCGTKNSLARKELPQDAAAVEEIFPVQYNETVFRNNVRAFLCTDPDVPDDIFDTLNEQELNLNFWPMYKHRVSYEASWTAESGIEQSGDTPPVWQGCSGHVYGEKVFYSPGSELLQNRTLAQFAVDMIDPENYAAIPYHPEILGGTSALVCDCPDNRFDKEYVMNPMQEIIEDQCIDQVPGDYVRKMNFTSRITSREAQLQLVPFWIFVFEWNSKLFVILQNASTGQINGSVPKTIKRKLNMWLLTLTAALVILLLSYLAYKLTDKFSAAMVFFISLPAAAAGVWYREAVISRKSAFKLLLPSELPEAIQSLRRMEKVWLTTAYAFIAAMAILAVTVTAALPFVFPKYWRTVETDQDSMHKSTGVQLNDAPEKIIKLKRKKIQAISNQLETDDTTFEIEL